MVQNAGKRLWTGRLFAGRVSKIIVGNFPSEEREMKLAFATLGWLTLAAASNAGMFFDGDFLEPDWSLVNVVGPAGGQTGTHVMTGGNPDMFRSVLTTTNSIVQSAHVRSGWNYDTTLGAVQAIEWSIDYRNINSFGQGHAYALMVEQGGVYYRGGGATTGSTSFVWESHNGVLVEANFIRMDGGGGNPNFSSGVLNFGFCTSNDGGNGINVGYDNLSINFVPEPSTVAVVGLGIAFFVARRRK